MQANSWHHKLFHFHLPFWIWKVWKGREKIQKCEYLEKSFSDEIKKSIFHSFWMAIIWWKNKNLIKNFNFVLESLFNKVACLQANFIKKKLQHRCFPVNIAKFFKDSFFIEHIRWLLLSILNICPRWSFKETIYRVQRLLEKTTLRYQCHYAKYNSKSWAGAGYIKPPLILKICETIVFVFTFVKRKNNTSACVCDCR